MNNQQIEQYRKILANAPEGATHVDDSFSFWSSQGANGFHMFLKNEFVDGFAPLNPSLLSDIQTIVDQYDENQALKARVDELEQSLTDANANLVQWNGLMIESQGVAGYHLNGDIAEWDEFEFTTEHPLIVAENHLNQRDIEQQIKALEAISLYFSSDDGLDRKVVSHIESEIEQLRQQAKEVIK